MLLEGVAAQAECEAGIARFVQQGKSSRRLIEAQALSRVAHSILQSALARAESRGAHFRNDFPHRDDEQFRRHSILAGDGQVRFEEW
jgi:succinate dehydrogenase/fumarate reductase flavoprotein subunit